MEWFEEGTEIILQSIKGGEGICKGLGALNYDRLCEFKPNFGTYGLNMKLRFIRSFYTV